MRYVERLLVYLAAIQKSSELLPGIGWRNPLAQAEAAIFSPGDGAIQKGFDCGVFPTIVIGFGRRECPRKAQESR